MNSYRLGLEHLHSTPTAIRGKGVHPLQDAAHPAKTDNRDGAAIYCIIFFNLCYYEFLKTKKMKCIAH
jgi:hypothetical protein